MRLTHLMLIGKKNISSLIAMNDLSASFGLKTIAALKEYNIRRRWETAPEKYDAMPAPEKE